MLIGGKHSFVTGGNERAMCWARVCSARRVPLPSSRLCDLARVIACPPSSDKPCKEAAPGQRLIVLVSNQILLRYSRWAANRLGLSFLLEGHPEEVRASVTQPPVVFHVPYMEGKGAGF